MGSQLYYTNPAFREVVDLCVSICKEHGFPHFFDLITNDTIEMSVKHTVQTQLAVLTLEIALYVFWKSVAVPPSMSWGIRWGGMLPCTLLAFSPYPNVLYLVGRRSLLLLERCEPDTCAMLYVSMPVEEV